MKILCIAGNAGPSQQRPDVVPGSVDDSNESEESGIVATSSHRHHSGGKPKHKRQDQVIVIFKR